RRRRGAVGGVHLGSLRVLASGSILPGPSDVAPKLHPNPDEGHGMAGLLAKERIIAVPGFDRWLGPPAALAIHFSIGMAYGFSVFWLPLSRAIGITQSAPDD